MKLNAGLPRLKHLTRSRLTALHSLAGLQACSSLGSLAPRKDVFAFTLAEMMVVMLILSIVLAAFAPVMTTRSKSDRTSPWRYTSDNTNIYYGLGDNQIAMIGQPNKVNGTDPSTRLIINTSDDTQKHISFKRGENNLLGNLFMSSNSLVLGNGSISGSNNISLGLNALKSNTGSENTAVGSSALSNNTSGEYNTAIGKSSLSSNSTSSYNTAIGAYSASNTTGSNNTAIGYKADVTGNSAIAIGSEAKANGSSSVVIGSGSKAKENGIAIGSAVSITANQNIAIGNNIEAKMANNIFVGSDLLNENNVDSSVIVGNSAGASDCSGENSYMVAIGNGAQACGWAGSIAIGNKAQAIGKSGMFGNATSIAIGNNAKAAEYNGIAIGYNTLSNGTGGIVLGNGSVYGDILTVGTSSIAIGGSAVDNASITIGAASQSTGTGQIALGYHTILKGENNIAIGSEACKNITGSNKICIGNNSGPPTTQAYRSDNKERVFIGSQSKFNNGNAVLEVHNVPDKWSVRDYGQLPNNATSVVINGNLLLRGRLVMQPEVYHKNYVYDYCTMTMTSGDANDYPYYRYCGAESDSLQSSLSSDRRLKYVGSEITSGLEKIKQLKIFNYTYKKDKKKTPHVGVIAQDLQKVFPDAVTKNKDGYLTIRMEDMFYALINAVKELALKMDKNEQKIVKLEKENQELKSRLDKLEKQLK